MSSGAFSGKKKAALLKAKRKTQRERQERSADEDAAQASRATERGADGRPRLKTVLQREEEHDVQQGRADATRPLELTPAAQHALLLPWPEELQPPVSMPVRPQWTYEDGPEALDAREAAAFAAWNAQLQAAHARESLSRYERNLEVWRQLWRTSEVSDALLLVVDIRTPLISFPAPLYEYEAARGTAMVVVLNKADLLPPAVVAAWASHLQQRFPRLTAVVPFRADPGAAPKGFKGGGGSRKTGFNRWRGGDEAVRDDVEALLKAIKALPVTREGVARTFADFWAPDAVAAQAADAAVPDAADAADALDDDARAAAALQLSAGWASQQSHADDAAARHADAARALRRYVTLGVVGEPNMGKSAVINRLFRAPVVKASPTPGCTKHLQTLFLRPLVRLADCPGLIFPKRGVPFGMQLLCGNTPIAQAREPFATIRYLAEAGVHPPLPAAYGLSLHDVAEHSSRVQGTWSPYGLCEALAIKRSFLTRGGRPDVFRAANRILRDALAGKNIRLAFVPPGMPSCPWEPVNGAGVPSVEGEPSDEDSSSADGSESASDDDHRDDPAAIKAEQNPFAALEEED